MKVINYDGKQENQAITALCLDTNVLAKVHDALGPSPFANRWSNQVAKWCTDFYAAYGEAPGIAGITALYDKWAHSANKNDAELVYRWLSSLPAESGLQSDYAIDLIEDTVSRTQAKALATAIDQALARGNSADAAAAIEAWRRPQIAQRTVGIHPLTDVAAIAEAFAITQAKPLITYPGAFGEWLGNTIEKDSLVSIMGPTGTGKSTWLLELGLRAAKSGNNVAYFSIGDMSQAQVIRRMIPKLARRPLYTGKFNIPTELAYKDKEPQVKHEPHYATGCTEEQAQEAFAAHAASSEKFKLLTYPALSIGTGEIVNHLETWAGDGWSPDIIVIDYADLLKLPNVSKEKRTDNINVCWQLLRAISTTYHCCVLTATQSDTEGFRAWLLDRHNFSESKTKLDSCTAVIGLNQTPNEKDKQVMRLNYAKLREGEGLSRYGKSVVAVAGCMLVGAPVIKSCWV